MKPAPGSCSSYAGHSIGVHQNTSLVSDTMLAEDKGLVMAVFGSTE